MLAKTVGQLLSCSVMTNNPEHRLVLVYEHVESRLDTLVGTARRAGWIAYGFDNEQMALEEFSDNINALIVGASGDLTKPAHKGRLLLERSHGLAAIPRALLVNNLQQARQWERPNSQDILLNVGARTSNNMIRLAGWLRDLAVEITPSSE